MAWTSILPVLELEPAQTVRSQRFGSRSNSNLDSLTIRGRAARKNTPQHGSRLSRWAVVVVRLPCLQFRPAYYSFDTLLRQC